MNTKPRIGIVGATGAVGTRLLDILSQRDFPVGDLKPFASTRSLGKLISFRSQSFACQVLSPESIRGLDLVFLDAADEISKLWVPQLLDAGAWVIDNSAVYRMNADVPLVVPEVNGEEVDKLGRNSTVPRVIAGPNCTTAQLVMALQPLHQVAKLKRVLVSSYQSVSGAGSAAISALKAEIASALSSSQNSTKTVFNRAIAFNYIPQIGGFSADGSTSEERKIMEETKKILGLPRLLVSATAVRVPVLIGHGESVHCEFEGSITPEAAREALSKFPGIQLWDRPEEGVFPTAHDAAGTDPVWVGRVRKDLGFENGIQMFVVADNLRKGAALNAVQIAERLIACGALRS